ncbi:MAG: 23S rRNA (adenine(1618)-N(6))-methyltransferase RlmF [Oceanospirillaceae bacterium]
MLKQNLHPRNIHNTGYDFAKLLVTHPDLKPFLIAKEIRNTDTTPTDKHPNINAPTAHSTTLNFANPNAVITLNTALLKTYYRIKHWQLPPGYLCPPIPGRVDYIHYLADLLNAASQHLKIDHTKVTALDIGTGASCIYPILGQRCYQWQFIASDIDPVSVACAQQLIITNQGLAKKINVRLQPDAKQFFNNIIDKQKIDITLCNPPFHASLAQALASNKRKRDNLASNRSAKLAINATNDALNFGGQKAELYCEGGELAFIKSMINESALFKQQVLYFTCLVSKSVHLKELKQQLSTVKAVNVQVIKMSQGQKISHFIAWSFLNNKQQAQWFANK